MIEKKVFNTTNKPSLEEKTAFIDFLFENLEEFGDPKFLGSENCFRIKEEKEFLH